MWVQVCWCTRCVGTGVWVQVCGYRCVGVPGVLYRCVGTGVWVQVYRYRCVRLTDLSEVQGDVDLVELSASGQRRALPPPLGSVDGVGDGVGAFAVVLTADVTILALRTRRTLECK